MINPLNIKSPKGVAIIDISPQNFFMSFIEQAISNTYIGFNSFLTQLSHEFDAESQNQKDNELKELLENEGNVENALKRTTYYNIKNIYENISGFNRRQSTTDSLIAEDNDPNNIKKLTLSDISEYDFRSTFSFSRSWCDAEISDDSDNFYDFYQIFQVIDRGNNDIGADVLANLAYLYNTIYTDFGNVGDEALQKLTGSSLFGLLSGIAQESGFFLQQIPNYFNINSAVASAINPSEIVSQLFGTHTDINLLGSEIPNLYDNIKSGGGIPGLPGYIFQLGSITSELENHGSDGEQDDKYKNYLRNSFCLDVGYDDNNNDVVAQISDYTPYEIKNSNITCFTIDFGRQNQQLFNNIQLDTSQFYDTEESLRVWTSLVNSTQLTKPNVSNLYPILERRSYTCTVSGLGNATIQPLTYFYLRNVPLFYGTYWITNVTHNITPNNMVTTFQGVRQSIAGRQDSRKVLLDLLSKTSAELKKTEIITSPIITEGVPNTAGKFGYVTDSALPYGEIAQEVTTQGGSYWFFSAQDIIGSYVYSITQDNNDIDANKAVIYYIYNLTKAIYYGNTHEEIISHMIDIVLHIIDSAYKISGKFSISKFLNQTGGYNKLSANGENIAAILEQIQEVQNIENNIKLSDGKFLYDIQFNKNYTASTYTPSVNTDLPLSEILNFISSTHKTTANGQYLGFNLQSLDNVLDADKKISVGSTFSSKITGMGAVKYIGALSTTNNTYLALFSYRNPSDGFGSTNLSTRQNRISITTQKTKNEFKQHQPTVITLNGDYAEDRISAAKYVVATYQKNNTKYSNEKRQFGIDAQFADCSSAVVTMLMIANQSTIFNSQHTELMVKEIQSRSVNNSIRKDNPIGGDIMLWGGRDDNNEWHGHIAIVTEINKSKVYFANMGISGAKIGSAQLTNNALNVDTVWDAPYFLGFWTPDTVSDPKQNKSIPLDNAYYTIRGKWIGSDNVNNGKAFICDGKNADGTFINARDIGISNAELLDRANWVYGECGGSGFVVNTFVLNKIGAKKPITGYNVSDYYAFAIKNIAKEEGNFYNGAKRRVGKTVDGKAINTYEGYFTGSGLGGNTNSKKFAKAKMTSMNELMKVLNAQNAISGVIKSITEQKDPTAGASYWRGEDVAKDYYNGKVRGGVSLQFTFKTEKYYHSFFSPSK